MLNNKSGLADLPSAAEVTQKVSEIASQVKEKVSDLGRSAASKMDTSRNAVASGLEDAASTLHEKGQEVSSMAHSAAAGLSSTAKYVRKHNVRDMMADVGRAIRRNPGPSLIAATAVVGFVVVRSIRND